MWGYADSRQALRDVLRLSRAMTYKSAVADLPLGGGKGVIMTAPGEVLASEKRAAALLDFGDTVESLGGRYVTAEDVGTSSRDMRVIAQRTGHVAGLPRRLGGSGDPSPFTAIGVEAAMRASARAHFGSPELAGRRIVIAGLGHVGEKLARGLVRHGAEVAVSDIDPRKREIAMELVAEWIPPAEELVAECDILAPCALGGAIDAANLPLLRCEVICGCANNQLDDDGLASELAERGILYAPDFVVNAGGLIHVYREIRGYSEERARELALGIEENLDAIFEAATDHSVTPLKAAREVALERLANARVESTAVA
jgi:leucine dehydrogenase